MSEAVRRTDAGEHSDPRTASGNGGVVPRAGGRTGPGSPDGAGVPTAAPPVGGVRPKAVERSAGAETTRIAAGARGPKGIQAN